MIRTALLLIASSLLLSACGFGADEELPQWMTRQRAQAKAQIEAISEPKPYTPKAYSDEASVDPFNREKLTVALRRDAGQATANAGLLTPELSRRKEPLEAYPLDAMTMVGSLTKQGRPVALVRVDNLIYQVRPGQYLGQNYGRIVKVGDSEVVLREIVQESSGEWVERAATLQLQERAK
jgi:type IV pilus assembly protein PilP